jgi:hypothetical protein
MGDGVDPLTVPSAARRRSSFRSWAQDGQKRVFALHFPPQILQTFLGFLLILSSSFCLSSHNRRLARFFALWARFSRRSSLWSFFACRGL